MLSIFKTCIHKTVVVACRFAIVQHLSSRVADALKAAPLNGLVTSIFFSLLLIGIVTMSKLQGLIVATLFAVVAVARADSGTYITAANETSDVSFVTCSPPTDGDSIYNYSIAALNSTAGTIHFSAFKGRPILIVNVASYCHSTMEYPMYNKLIEKFGEKFALVAFPSNNFQNVSFPLFSINIV